MPERTVHKQPACGRLCEDGRRRPPGLYAGGRPFPDELEPDGCGKTDLGE